jgi:hypothetical protein
MKTKFNDELKKDVLAVLDALLESQLRLVELGSVRGSRIADGLVHIEIRWREDERTAAEGESGGRLMDYVQS